MEKQYCLPLQLKQCFKKWNELFFLAITKNLFLAQEVISFIKISNLVDFLRGFFGFRIEIYYRGLISITLNI